MKLKKIASLMLAGIMAVSMLAGCKSNTVDENPGTEPEKPAASSASTTLYDALSADTRLSITSAVANTAMDQALEDALETTWMNAHMGYWYNQSLSNQTNYTVDLKNIPIAKDVTYALKAKAGFEDNSSVSVFKDTKGDVTAVKVYAVGGNHSEKGALTWVADQIDKDVKDNLPSNGTKDGVNYEYDYSVAASIASESFTYQGTEYILRFVAVAVTQTAEAV